MPKRKMIPKDKRARQELLSKRSARGVTVNTMTENTMNLKSPTKPSTLRAATIATTLLIFTFGAVATQAAERKLTIGAYLSGAKISIAGEQQRPDDGLFLLDTCEIFYGAVPEAYALRLEILSLKVEKMASEDLAGRKCALALIAAYKIKLTTACAAETIKEKLRRDCDKLKVRAEAVSHKWFAEYYNSGISLYKPVEDQLSKDYAAATDSTEKKEIKAQIDTAIANTLANLEMAGLVAPDDLRPILKTAEIVSLNGDFKRAAALYEKGLALTESKDTARTLDLLNELAYTYYSGGEYAKSAAAYARAVPLAPAENKKGLLHNAALCFSALNNADSAHFYNLLVLALDPKDAGALAALGGWWFSGIPTLNQKIAAAREKSDKSTESALAKELSVTLDSAGAYLKRATEADTNDVTSLEYFAIVSSLAAKNESACEAWKKLTILKPDDKKYWLYLGDSNIMLKKFKDAIPAYERYSVIDPSDATVWSQLADLYRANGMTDKGAQAQAKADQLKK